MISFLTKEMVLDITTAETISMYYSTWCEYSRYALHISFNTSPVTFLILALRFYAVPPQSPAVILRRWEV